MSWELIIWTCIVPRRRNNIGIDYVPAKMAAYGVFRPPLMTYDVQWRATYFLSINLPFAPTAF